MINTDMLESNAEKCGYAGCMLQTIEECAELQQAIIKAFRVSGNGQPTDVSESECSNNLIEELIDVYICLRQLMFFSKIGKHDLGEMANRKLVRSAARFAERGE